MFVIVLTFALWYVNVAHLLLFPLVFDSCCFCFVCAVSFVIKEWRVLVVIGCSEEKQRHTDRNNHTPKPVNPDTMLIPYEQLFIQANHKTGNLVPEQNINEANPVHALQIPSNTSL
jgi:hypothetical protein